MLALLAIQEDFVTVPAFVAYCEPDPNGIGIEGEGGTGRWDDAKQTLCWYGTATRDGEIEVASTVETRNGQTLTMTVGKTRHAARPWSGYTRFGSFPVKRGPVRIELSVDRAPGPSVRELWVTGPARWPASKRRNAASVHLWWDAPKDAKIRWFTNEAAMLTDPLGSYTMACGFSRGYFGMQVNSPTERRIIFSVWDAGSEAVDRSKVGAENRVELVAKGEGVVADSFGNEGTGGHSHLVYPWKTGVPLRFLVGCRPEGDKTLYAGYFMGPGDKDWRLLAAFRAPKDGGTLRGLYSFSEDFVGANGQKWRESALGNGWIGLGGGVWSPLDKARFTTDDHGRAERWDTDAFVKDGRFHLRHGGFAPGTARYGDALTVAKAGKRPEFALPTLPK